MTSGNKRAAALAALFLLGFAALYASWSNDVSDPSNAGPPGASGPREESTSSGDVPAESVAGIGRSDGEALIEAIAMAPETAYSDAMSIMRCESAVQEIQHDPNMTEEQVAQFEASRVEGVDCSALDSPYTAQELAKFAAERGNIQAQIDYPALAAGMFKNEANALDPELIAQYKSDSLRFLNSAASRGNTDAHMRLAANYSQGLFADRDMAKAYAHAYAVNQIRPSRLTQKLLDRYAVELSADELLRAQQLGRRLTHR